MAQAVFINYTTEVIHEQGPLVRWHPKLGSVLLTVDAMSGLRIENLDARATAAASPVWPFLGFSVMIRVAWKGLRAAHREPRRPDVLDEPGMSDGCRGWTAASCGTGREPCSGTWRGVARQR